MMNPDEQLLTIATDRFERRLAEETGKLRVEIADVRVAIEALRADGIERTHELLKWAMGLWVAGVAAMAALLAFFR